MADEWENTKPASLEVTGKGSVVFPIDDQRIRVRARTVPRNRPYRPGTLQDSTGVEGDELTLDALFFNTIQEPGLGDGPLWPDRADLFETILRAAMVETATLHLPWRRNIRCKVESFERTGGIGERDGERFTVDFGQDNEEELADVVFQASARATARIEAEEALLDAEAVGAYHPMLEAQFDADGFDGITLLQLAEQIETYLSAPSNYAEDIAVAGRRMQRACRRVRSALTTFTPGRDIGNRPEGSRLMLRLLTLEDLGARAIAEAEEQLPKTIEVRFDRPRTLWAIAAERGQDGHELISINGEIEDPNYVPAGTPVKVLA